MVAKVSVLTATQDISFLDSISTKYSSSSQTSVNYCGERVYTLSPTHDFNTITVVGSPKITLATNNVNDSVVSGGMYPMTLTVTL
jgi:hypothetical protein